MNKRDLKGDRFKEFLAEAEDILNSMGKELMKLGKGVKAGIIDPAVLNSIFRSAHTLKGMSGIFDFRDMTTLSHSLEDTLDLLRLGKVTLSGEVLDSVIASHGLLVKIISSKGRGDFTAEIEGLQAMLKRSCQARKPDAREKIDSEILSVLTDYEEHRFRENLRAGHNIFIVNVKFPITSFDRGYVALTELLKTKAEVIATLPSTKSSHEMLYFNILIGTRKSREHILETVRGMADSEITVLSEPATHRPATSTGREPALEVIKGHGRMADVSRETLRRVSNTVRVNIGKLDYIMSIISELGILKTNVASLSTRLRNEKELSVYGIELSRTEKNLERKLNELRDSVLDIRMVPIGQLFGRFETFLAKISREAHKETRMVTHGDETELDKLIVEELADPLMHIIRNVLDHAMEAPAVREALGKPRIGTITLSAYQKGNHVVIEVKDDGAGMDIELLKEKAVEKGVLTKEASKTLSRQDALDLIFMPGFSTRDVVSETSGRGVGMDVVKENITRLSGIIDIETVKGKGTRFILTIPITLAIIQALIVEAAETRYAVALNSVLEIIELHRDSLDASGKDIITVNGRDVPSVRLSRFFGKQAREREVCYGIVAGLAEHRLCIIVDSLVEELDVVIKPLSRILKVPGIAGATDMGEKGTILVLDVTGILEQVLKERKSLVRG
ncbi:MAG: chemotaxis protein CheA [Thermodesulfobacteriota bacterium]